MFTIKSQKLHTKKLLNPKDKAQHFGLGLLCCLALNVESKDLPNYEFVDIGTLGGQSSVATAINEKRQVVGWSTVSKEENCISMAGTEPCKVGFFWYDAGFDTIAALSEGVDRITPTAINDEGKVVGYQQDYRLEDNRIQVHIQPLMWQSGQTLELPLPEKGTGAAHDINQYGEIVGWYQMEGETQRIAVWKQGRFIEVSPDSKMSRRGIGINSSGWVTGWEYEPRSFLPNQAFLVQKQHISLSDNRYHWSESMAINDYGAIAGNTSTAVHRPGKAAIWYKTILGTYHKEVIGDLNSSFLDINNRGSAVGYQIHDDSEANSSSALLYFHGELYDLNRVLELDVHLAEAKGINDAGDIVGYYINKEGDKRAFLLLAN